MTIKYANRTCDKCGARKPQPEMVRKEVYVETGKSTATISTNTWLGVMGGDKASGRAVKRAMFNNGERTYTRKKTVWSCRNCNAPYVTSTIKKSVANVIAAQAPIVKKEAKPATIIDYIVTFIFLGFCILMTLAVLSAIFSG